MLQSEATLIDERKASMGTFNLEQHQLTVGEVHRNLPPSSLYEHAIRYEKDASIAENGALVAYSGVKTGRSPEGQAGRQASGFGKGRLVGAGQHPVRRADVRDQSPARDRLPEHARAPLLLRRLRRLGPEVSHQGPRDLLAPLPRALHAHHADPADAGGAGELRQARLHDLQRGRLSRPTASPPAWARRRASR